jgi:phosphohistidine phosphatase SixA
MPETKRLFLLRHAKSSWDDPSLEQQHNFIRDIKACGRVAAARDADCRSCRR